MKKSAQAHLPRIITGLAIAAGLAYAASASAHPNEPTPRSDTRKVVIQGRLSPEDVSDVAHAQIAVYRLEADGGIVEIPKATRTAHRDGRYMIKLDIPRTDTELIIHAANDRGAGDAVISVPATTKSASIVAPPLDAETGFEALVAVTMRSQASGLRPGWLGVMRSVVTRPMAIDLRARPGAKQDVDTLARAIGAGMMAWTDMLEHPTIGAETRAVDGSLMAFEVAQAAVDAQLDLDVRSQEQAEHLRERLLAAWLADAGLSADQLALAAEAMEEAMRPELTMLPTDVRGRAFAEASGISAYFATAAVADAFESLGAELTDRQFLAAAAERLRQRIVHAADTAEPSGEAVRQAWTTFSESVEVVFAHTALRGRDLGAKAELREEAAALDESLETRPGPRDVVEAFGNYVARVSGKDALARLMRQGVDPEAARAVLMVRAVTALPAG